MPLLAHRVISLLRSNRADFKALERESWNHTEIDRRDRVRMVAEERLPTLRWRPSAPDHVFGDRRLGNLEPELQQFSVDPRGTPQRVVLAHPIDQFAQLTADRGPSCSNAGFPAPIGAESCAFG